MAKPKKKISPKPATSALSDKGRRRLADAVRGMARGRSIDEAVEAAQTGRKKAQTTDSNN